MTDEKLIKDCIRGKRSAQNLLYDRFKGLLMNISMRYARNEEDADDIFQEAFIKVFHNLHQIRHHGAMSSWIYQCAVRVAINHYRSSRKMNFMYREEANEESSNEDYKSIIDAISGEEIIVLIKELPEGYRLVFNMYVIDGFKHKEIAAALNITENTSRSQLRDARNALKKILITRGTFKYEEV